AAPQEQVQVWRGDGFRVDDDSRRGAIARLTPGTEDLVQDRLWEVMPELEARFGCEVTHLSGVTALIYDAGDHFAAHSDGGGDDGAPDEVRRRRVSLVVALNAGAGDAADFSGGELEFYAGSLPGIAARTPSIMTVHSAPGLLIAFASSMIHRVAPVVAGRRYSLALWALAP
ncbi:MAG: SM-20-related protein, partial [Solirubrobacteraceae bacterium]|nr:SM-20-related protein [Solirubrobacteraceae bacterium]